MPTDIQVQTWSLAHVVEGLKGILDRKMGVKLDRTVVKATALSSRCRREMAFPRPLKAVVGRETKMVSLASCGLRPNIQ